MKKPTFRLAALVSTLLLIQPPGALAQTSASDLHVWAPGTTVSYTIVNGQTQTIEIPGQGVQEMPVTSTTGMTVEAVEPRQFKITITESMSPGSPISTEGLEGLEATVELDERGLISSVEGLDGNAVIEQLGGPQAFSESFQSIFLYLPEGDLAPGVSWTREFNIPISRMGLEMVRETNDTFTCTQRTTFEGTDAYEIETETEISMTGSGNQGGQELDMVLEGTISGKIFVDAETGQLLSMEQTGSMVGMIDMAGGSLPMTIDLNVTAGITE